MEMKDLAENIRNQYEGLVKTHIDDGFYQLAGFEMANLNMEFVQPNESQIRMYHSGGNFVASSSLLEEELKKENSDPERWILRFEAYLAQLELSIKSGNVFG